MIGQIILNSRSRFQVDTVELTSGDTLEVLVIDGQDNLPKWISTRVEHNGDNYYLVGLLGYNPIGLFAKVQKIDSKSCFCYTFI